MVKTFVGSALSVGKSGIFYGPIKRSNIKTFSGMNKQTKLRCRALTLTRFIDADLFSS
jgi:hypothetical protein